MCSGSVFKGGYNFFQTSIKVKRSLIAKHGIFIEFQRFAEVFNIIDYCTVTTHYTLGYAGGAGSKYNVDGICVDLTVSDSLQSSIINFTCCNLVIAVNLPNVIQLLGNRKSCIVADAGSGVKILQNQFYPIPGHICIQRNIVAAGIDGTKKSGDGLRMLFHKHHDRLLIIATADHFSANAPCLVLHLPEGQFPVLCG